MGYAELICKLQVLPRDKQAEVFEFVEFLSERCGDEGEREMKKEKLKITKSSGNVFLDLGFPPDEAAILAMRSDLMCQLETLIRDKQWSQAEAAQVLGISQSRVSDLIRGKFEKLSLDMLITLATRAGKKVQLKLAA